MPALHRRLWICAAIALLLALLFWLYPKNLSLFALQIRAEKLAVIALLSICGGVSTLVFQTLSGNRLLTPQLMGIDGIYRLLQASLILLVGAPLYTQLSPYAKFGLSAIISMLVSSFFFIYLLDRLRGDLFRLLLIGVIFSGFCRAMSGFIGRMLDPLAYAVYQSASFAQLSQARVELIGIAALPCLLSCAFLWKMRHELDVLALGRDSAINLGLPYLRCVMFAMLALSLLVAIATALVGPMLFFGLLASALTYRLIPCVQHGILIPAVALISFCILLGGQLIFERLLNMAGTLSIAVEFIGGLLFLVLILRKAKQT